MMDAGREQKTIVQFYAAFAASLLCNFIPLAIVQLFGISLLFAVLIAGYIYKARASLDSLTYNHMTYLIGTIWIGSTFLLIGMAIATYWVYAQGDHSLIFTLMESLNAGTPPDPAQVENVMSQYIQANKQLLITATIATVSPGMIYMIYRTACGLNRAAKGYRLAKPAGWL